MKPLTLDLALITHRPEGILRIAAMNLPRVEGVRYVVSWQQHENTPIPDALERNDVSVYRLDAPGLSRNRNNALDHCTADVVLIADDDCIYTPERLRIVAETFQNNPDVDVATFRSLHGDMSRFPARETSLNAGMPRGYSAASFEIALRRSSAGFLRCCPELGLGAPRLQSGEDEILLHTAIRHGLNTRFFPITICDVPGESTGTRSDLSDGHIRGFGCTIALMYPGSALLRIPLKAWRLSHAEKASLPRALRLLAAGALAAPGVRRRNRRFF